MFGTSNYTINNCSITIKDRYFLKSKNRRLVSEAILNGAKNFEFLREIGNVTVILLGETRAMNRLNESFERTGCFIISDEIQKGIKKIYVNAFKIAELIKKDEEKASINISEMIIHELRHIYDELKNQLISNEVKVRSRLFSRLGRMLFMGHSLDAPILFDIVKIRDALNQFITNVHSEGLATFAQEYSGKPLTEQEFKKKYSEATEIAHFIKYDFEDILKIVDVNPEKVHKKTIELQKTTKSFSYSVGAHMVYSILFLDKNSKINDLSKMSYLKFITKYEDIMMRQGYNPVITLRKYGIFQYNSILLTLEEKYKKIEEKILN